MRCPIVMNVDVMMLVRQHEHWFDMNARCVFDIMSMTGGLLEESLHHKFQQVFRHVS